MFKRIVFESVKTKPFEKLWKGEYKKVGEIKDSDIIENERWRVSCEMANENGKDE